MCGLAAAPAEPAASAATEVFEACLANGMKVLVRPDARAPTAVHMVWYRVGSMDETLGVTGVAHVLEHMMFKGTRTVPAGEFSRRVAAMGGRENAFTGRDFTAYFQQIPAARLPEVMALEADRMHNLQLEPEAFAKEIQVVMEERRLRTEDRPMARAHEQLMATALQAHPYRHPIIGWMDDLENMTVADTQRWYQDWYGPGNATLVVVGAVEPAAVLALAEQTYGQVPARALPTRKPHTEPVQQGVRRLELKAPAEHPYVVMAFRVPALRPGSYDREAYALEMLSAILDGGESARLTQRVVNGARVANQAGAGYELVARGPALFVLDGVPAAGRSTEQLEAALWGEIRRIAEHGVPAADLQRATVRYVAEQVYKRDSMFAQAMEMGGLETAGHSYRDADRMLANIRAVTAAEVQAVASKYFKEDGLTVVTLRPQPLGAPRVPSGQSVGRHGL